MTVGRKNRTTSPAKDEKGFVLVVVLWMLAALAALAASYAIYVDNAAFATQVNDDRIRIRNTISSGVELAAYQLLARPVQDRPPQGALRLVCPGRRWT